MLGLREFELTFFIWRWAAFTYFIAKSLQVSLATRPLAIGIGASIVL